MTDLDTIVRTLNDRLADIEASKSATDAEVKAAHALLDEWYAERQAVDIALKSAVEMLSDDDKVKYGARLAAPETAIPCLKEMIDANFLKYAFADDQCERLKYAVSFLNKETGKLEKAKAGLGSVVRFLNEQNDDLTAHNQRLEDAVAYLNNEAQQLSVKVEKRDAFIGKRYGVSVDETPESAFVDLLKEVYHNFTAGDEREFDKCAQHTAKYSNGKNIGTKEVVDMVKIIAGYDPLDGKRPGKWFGHREGARAVSREACFILTEMTPSTDVPEVFDRLRSAKSAQLPLSFIADYVTGSV